MNLLISLPRALPPAAASVVMAMAASVSADVDVINTTPDSSGAEVITNPSEQTLEADGGVAGDLQVAPYQGAFNYASGELRVDNGDDDDGITHLQIGGQLLLGSDYADGRLSASGEGAGVSAAQGIELSGRSGLAVRNGAEVTTAGTITYRETYGQYGGVDISLEGHGSKLVSQSAGGGRIALEGVDTSHSVAVLRGAELAALGSGAGGGSFALGGRAMLRVGGPGARLVAQEQIDLVGHSTSAAIYGGAQMVQLAADGGAPGLKVAPRFDPGTGLGQAAVQISGRGTRVQVADDIQLGNTFGQVHVDVTDYATLATDGQLLVGTDVTGNPPGYPQQSSTLLTLAEGGTLEAEQVVIKGNGTVQAGPFVYPSTGPKPPARINADVVVNGGTLDTATGPLSIEGDLDLSSGAVRFDQEPDYSGLRVDGQVLLGEGSLIRMLVRAVPRGEEILLDGYFGTADLAFSPGFALSNQLRVESPYGLVAGSEILFRLAALDQTYRYRVPEHVVPEINANGAGLALGLLGLVAAWRREARRREGGGMFQAASSSASNRVNHLGAVGGGRSRARAETRHLSSFLKPGNFAIGLTFKTGTAARQIFSPRKLRNWDGWIPIQYFSRI